MEDDAKIVAKMGSVFLPQTQAVFFTNAMFSNLEYFVQFLTANKVDILCSYCKNPLDNLVKNNSSFELRK